jgi:hypothetical protein
MNKIYILTGGTFNHVAPHFSLAAPAYGQVGEDLYKILKNTPNVKIELVKTKMAAPHERVHPEVLKAGLSKLETNDDLKSFLIHLSLQPETKSVILACAVTDFKINLSQKTPERLDSSQSYTVTLEPSEKLLPHLNDKIYTVSFKTLFDADATVAEAKAKKNLKSSDVILVNDIKTRQNGVASLKGLTWCDSRPEALKVIAFHIWRDLGLDNKKCYGCGMNTPVTFKNYCEDRKCDCGSKKTTIMAYSTILSYKYNL